MRLLVIRRTEYKPLGHVKASAGGIAPKQRSLLYQGKTEEDSPCLNATTNLQEGETVDRE